MIPVHLSMNFVSVNETEKIELVALVKKNTIVLHIYTKTNAAS